MERRKRGGGRQKEGGRKAVERRTTPKSRNRPRTPKY
jgi:hypothetical protein